MKRLPDRTCPCCGSAVLAGRRYCVNWLGCGWKREPVENGAAPDPAALWGEHERRPEDRG